MLSTSVDMLSPSVDMLSPSVDMLPFGVTIPATVPQRSESPEGLMNYLVYRMRISTFYITRIKCSADRNT
jgi:hypothetical protein